MHRRAGTRSTPFGRLAASLMGVALIGSLAATPALAVANGDPVPGRDRIDAAEDGPAVTGNVLANDTDPDGDTLTVASVHYPSAGVGTLVLPANGAYTFTPAANYNGTSIAWYFVTDGHGHTGIVYIDIVVSAVNDSPVAADLTMTINEDVAGTRSSAQLLAGATDPDGDVPTVTGVSNATGGSVAWASNTATFTPTHDLCGAAAGGFDYAISDGHGGSDTGHVTVNLTCVNDDPVAVGIDLDAVEDTDLVMAVDDLVANDTDPDGDSLHVTSVTDGTDGTTSLVAGTLTYSPDPDVCGIDAFDYDFHDGNGGSATGTATVTIECTNDAPTTVADTGEIAAYSPGADFDVAANDEDIDGDTLGATDAVIDDAAHGTVSTHDGLVRYVPADGFTGDAVITYTVSDGDLTAEGELTVTVTPDTTDPVVAAPVVTFGTGRVNETAPLRISWSGTDVAGSGVETYDVEVSVAGAPYAAVYTGSATAVTKLYAFGKDLAWRVRATDHAGNVSDWTTSATRRIVAYQGGYRVGAWSTVDTTSASGTAYRYATTKGAKITVTFTGREVLFVGTKGTRAGAARVYIDGVRLGTYSETATKTLYGRIIAAKAWGSSGSHRITVVAPTTGPRTTVDAFIVLK